MRQILALLLAVMLGNWSCFGQSPPVPPRSIEEQIRAIPPASPVELRLADGSNILIGVAVGVGAVAIAATVIFASGSVTW